MSQPGKILYAGTWESDYPRNQQMIRLLRRQGYAVIEIHEPFWENFRDKSQGFGGALGWIRLTLQLFLIYVRLILRLLPRLRTANALFIGYIGQLDMLVLGTIARLVRVPVVFNPLVTLTDTVVEDRGLAQPSSVGARLIWIIDWLSLRIANLVVTDTEENAEFLENRFGYPRSRTRVLFVGADECVFYPQVWGSNTRETPGLHVLFYGKMIPLHGIEAILDAVSLLSKEADNDSVFEIVGSGQQEWLVKAFQQAHPEVDLIYRPWVAYRRLPQRIASADCVLGVFGAGEKAGRVIPNKVFQAMAVGAPIITRESPAIRRVLQNGESAILVPPGDPVALANAIRTMGDAEYRARLGQAARESFELHASDAALDGQMKAILESITAQGGDRTSSRWCS